MYRASDNVRQGLANEHAYNMFLSFEEICCRLGLWDESVGWFECNKAFHRLTRQMVYEAAKTQAATSRFQRLP